MSTDLEFEDYSDGPNYSRLIKVCLATVAYVASLGIIIASDNDALTGLQGGLESALVVGSAIVLIAITFLWMKELTPGFKKDEPVSPRTKKSQLVLLASAVLGACLSFAFYAFQSGDAAPVELFTNAPIAPSLAIGLSLIYLVGVLYSSVVWQRNTDEHEKAAVMAGLYAGIGFYSVATPIWWLGQRASLLPEQDPMVMFVLVMAFLSAAWTYKRGA